MNSLDALTRQVLSGTNIWSLESGFSFGSLSPEPIEVHTLQMTKGKIYFMLAASRPQSVLVPEIDQTLWGYL
jgi:hypothetical protein